MNFYPYALLAHLIGVLGLFIALGLEVTSMLRLRRARTVEQCREWCSLNMSIARLRPFPVAALLILVGGISMVVISWDWTHAWIDTSLTLLVLMSALAPALQGRRLGAIHAEVAAAPDGAVPSTLRNKIEDPVLWSAVLGMGGVLLGVVTLMTLKSDSWPAAVAIIVVSTILGMAAGHALGRPAQAPEERPQPARADAAKS